MQFRDDKPTIIFPGHWMLFGETIESEESFSEGASRELKDEIKLHISPKEIVKIRQ